jgi:hypothetical protein
MVAIELYPLLATAGAAVVTLAAHRAFSGLGAARLSIWAISTQFVLAGAAWFLLELMPERTNWSSGGMCPDPGDIGAGLLVGVGFATAAVGGLVVATALIAAVRGVAPLRVLAFGPVAVALPYAAFLPLVGVALCGSN